MQKVLSIILMVQMKFRFNIFILLSSFCLVMVIISCEQTSLSNILCDGNIGYWEYVDDNEGRFPIYFLFDTKGRWVPLEQDEFGNINKYVISHCERYKEKWSLQGDSILYLGWDNKGYSIKSYCDSCVMLKQGENFYELRRIHDLQDAVNKNAKSYQEMKDSIMNMHYEIIVDSMIKQGDNFLVLGTSFIGEKEKITFSIEEISTLSPHRNDSLIKRKNWILINKVTEDSVFLYVYFISSRNYSLLDIESGLRTSYKQNVDGVLVK